MTFTLPSVASDLDLSLTGIDEAIGKFFPYL